MTKFSFKAKDWNGKLIKGVLDLPNEREVVTSIKESGLVLLGVSPITSGVVDDLVKKTFGRVGIKQITNFTRQLSTMMTAGLALTDALLLLKNQNENNRFMYEIVDYALTTVKGGQSLGSALGKYHEIFGEAYIASIEAGEEGGVLEEILAKLATSLENESEFRGKVKGAMIYPIIVIVGMVIVAFIMMIFVIPKLMGLYADFGTAKMPMVTQILMSISEWTVKLWFLFPVVIFGVMMLLKAATQYQALREKRDDLILRMPIIGVLAEKTILANTMRTLAMLLAAGLALVDALKIVANVSGNERFRKAIVRISERVQKGFSISNSFEETGVFPVIVNQMVATGEATGKLDEVLLKVSDYFSKEAEQSVKTLTSAIEPMIMILLGIGVGFLVVAVIMPIYNLTSSF
ncbi:MAG: type II secretion system F family protein [Candidatus Shapirobacteria bacterium]|jgi:type IV pilus assembly protein PilC